MFVADIKMSTDFDYIVVGCGGIGSAALYWLAKTAGNRKYSRADLGY